MAKETREVLTKEKCASDLKYKVRCNLINGVMAFFALLLVFGVFALGVYLACYAFDAPTVLTWILIILTFAVPFAYLGYVLRCATIEKRMIDSGAFSIVEDTLCGWKECEPDRSLINMLRNLPDRLHVVDVMYFAEYDRYVLSEDGGVLKYSLVDDVFYLVIYDSAPRKPVAIYNTRIYEWKNG